MTTTARTPSLSTSSLHRIVGATLLCAVLVAALLEDTDPKAAQAAGRSFTEQIAEARTRTKASPAANDALSFIFSDDEAETPDIDTVSLAASMGEDPAAAARKTPPAPSQAAAVTGPPLPTERNLPAMPVPVS